MYIHEAVKTAQMTHGFISRAAWQGVVSPYSGRAIKIQPTDTPAGCFIHNGATKQIRACWWPRAEDLVADDWEVIKL